MVAASRTADSTMLVWLCLLGMLAGLHRFIQTGESRSLRIVAAALGAGVTAGPSFVTGVLVIFFVVYHILHFTLGVVDAEAAHGVDALGRHDVYGMVVASFQKPLYSLSYVAFMVLIGFHLFHASHSIFQTAGVNHESYNGAIRLLGTGLVAVFVIGNCSIPLMILFGLIGPSGS